MVKHISSAEEFAAVKAAGKPVRRTLRTTARDDDLTDDEMDRGIFIRSDDDDSFAMRARPLVTTARSPTND